MATVPTSGAWKTDPELQRLLRAVLADTSRYNPTGRATNAPSASMRALMAYVNEEGPRLGIPSGYTVDPDTNQLKKEEGIPWTQIGLTSAAMLGGAYAYPALMGGTPAASASASGFAPGTGTAEGLTPTFAGGTGTAAGLTGAAGSTSWLDKAKGALTDPKNLLAATSIIPAAQAWNSGGSSNPFGNSALEANVNQALQQQNARYAQMQPIVDALVKQAYGRTPMNYRAEAPAGYEPNKAPSGAYQFNAPRFGG